MKEVRGKLQSGFKRTQVHYSETIFDALRDLVSFVQF